MVSRTPGRARPARAGPAETSVDPRELCEIGAEQHMSKEEEKGDEMP